MELEKKRQVLCDAVEAAQNKPGFDSLELSRLKKQKLALKEEIIRLQQPDSSKSAIAAE